MQTKTFPFAKCIINVVFLSTLVALSACSGQTAATTPTPLPTNTQPPPSPTPNPRPFADLQEWDLLIITDSSNWGVGEYYAKLIEADMNVKVNLHDCWVGGLSIYETLLALQQGGALEPAMNDDYCKRPWTELVKEAEVMVLSGNSMYSDEPLCMQTCMQGTYTFVYKYDPDFEGYKSKLMASCTPENWATYNTHIGSVIEEIYKIRDGRPIILRMTDLYIPVHATFKAHQMDEVCTACLVAFAGTIRQAAAEHGVLVADTMLGFNGSDYMSDPVELGYFKDVEHPSDKGAQFIASLLQQTGYDYSGE